MTHPDQMDITMSPIVGVPVVARPLETTLFPEDMTLKDAREKLNEYLEEGLICPLCAQNAKVYRFHINASQAVAAIRIWREGGTDWVDTTEMDLPHNLHAHMSKLRFWGILERPEGLVREDGSQRVGIWRVTTYGQAWIRGEIAVPSHARIYNNECLGLVGEPVSILETLGKKFSYQELMAA